MEDEEERREKGGTVDMGKEGGYGDRREISIIHGRSSSCSPGID